jgi:hypothetical protein
VHVTHRRSEANHSADHVAYETQQWTQHRGRRSAAKWMDGERSDDDARDAWRSLRSGRAKLA